MNVIRNAYVEKLKSLSFREMLEKTLAETEEYLKEVKTQLNRWRILEMARYSKSMAALDVSLFAREQEENDYILAILRNKSRAFDEKEQLIFEMGKMAGQMELTSAWYLNVTQDVTFEKNFDEVQRRRRYAKEIINAIYRRTGIQGKDLADAVGIKSNYLNEVSGMLEEALIIERRRGGRNTYYYLTPRAEQLLEKRKQKEALPMKEIERQIFTRALKTKLDERIYQEIVPVQILPCGQESRRPIGVNRQRREIPGYALFGLEDAVIADSVGEDERVKRLTGVAYTFKKGGNEQCSSGYKSTIPLMGTDKVIIHQKV